MEIADVDSDSFCTNADRWHLLLYQKTFVLWTLQYPSWLHSNYHCTHSGYTAHSIPHYTGSYLANIFISKSSLYTVSSFTEWWGMFVTKMMISCLLFILGSSSCVSLMRYMVFVRKNHTVVVIISDALCCMWLCLTPLTDSELG